MSPAPTLLAPGTRVRVRFDWPEARGPVHIRTPHYLRGRTGTVLRHLGDYPNPEDLAFARPAPILPLYHVAFAKAALWPNDTSKDELVAELYGPWLEAA
jgi:nitrile hydratase